MPYISTEEVKEKRKAIRKAFPDFKISVRCRDYSCINVSIMEGPIDLMPGAEKKYESVNHYYISEHFKDQPAIKKVLEGVYKIAAKGYETAFTDSDYGNVPTFYINMHIGKWDQPYKVVEKKVKKSTPKVSDSEEIKVVDYSEKAFAIIGETKPLKDKLKDLGGKFNFRLKCGAGWIFSKKKEAEVLEALNLSR